ncbi:hypothetical protein [Methyloversatilis sp.]|uniref:hypothetical protein n=1 Tax=Methyloversatilis sp. TaxID=2569862 RepID=UPI003D2674D7
MNAWMRRGLIAAVVVAAGAAGLWFGQSRQPQLAEAVTTDAARLEALNLADANG